MNNTSRPAKSGQTRESILNAAYGLIIRQGYAATSMRQIAESSGLALGGIYNHFSSKADVFRAIIQERHPFFRLIPMLSNVSGDTVEEYARNAAHALVGELARHPEFLNLMLIEIVEFKGKHAPALFEKRLLPMVMPMAQHLQALRGDLRPIPTFVLARAFLGMFFSYYITEVLIGRSLPPELRKINTMDHFVDIFLHGVLYQEAT